MGRKKGFHLHPSFAQLAPGGGKKGSHAVQQHSDIHTPLNSGSQSLRKNFPGQLAFKDIGTEEDFPLCPAYGLQHYRVCFIPIEQGANVVAAK